MWLIWCNFGCFLLLYFCSTLLLFSFTLTFSPAAFLCSAVFGNGSGTASGVRSGLEPAQIQRYNFRPPCRRRELHARCGYCDWGVDLFDIEVFVLCVFFIGPPGSWRVQEFVQERWPVVDQGAEPRDVLL